MRKSVSLTDISHEHTIVSAVFGSNVNSQEAIDFITGIVEDRLSLDSPYDADDYIDRNWDLSLKEQRQLGRVIKQLRTKAAKHINKTEDSQYAVFKVIGTQPAAGLFNLAIVTVGDRRIIEWNQIQEDKRQREEEVLQETEVHRPITASEVARNDRNVIRDAMEVREIKERGYANQFETCVRRARSWMDFGYAEHETLSDRELSSMLNQTDDAARVFRDEHLKQFNALRILQGISPIESFEEVAQQEYEAQFRLVRFDHVSAALESRRSHRR